MDTCTVAEEGATPYLCEYADKPFDDCYCRQITGRSVPKIARYCMERFAECPVFRRNAARDRADGPAGYPV